MKTLSKITLLITIFCFSSLFVIAQSEGGEDISSAIEITSLPFSGSGNTCDNLDDYDEDCGEGTSLSPDVVYSYTPTDDIMVTLDLCNSNYDTKMMVYVNDPFTLVACNDDFYGSGDPCGEYVSKIEDMVMEMGNTYYIVVDGYGDECGVYQLSMISTAFSGENIESAIRINSLPFNNTGNTCDKNDDYYNGWGCGTSESPDLVFRYIATLTGFISIDLCGSSYDTQLTVFENDESTFFACNDDYNGPATSCDELTSKIENLEVFAGNTYYIVVDGHGSNECGVYELNISNIFAHGNGGGEDFDVAEPISFLPFLDYGDTQGHDDDYDLDCGEGISNSPDLVYSYTPNTNIVVTLDLCNSHYDTKMMVYENDEYTLAACNDDFYGSGDPCGEFVSKIEEIVMYSGNTYYIVVDGYDGEFGEYQLSVMQIDQFDGSGGGENIAQAERIAGLPFFDSGNTCNSFDDYDVDCNEGTSTSPDVVYSFTPISDGEITIDLCHSGYDTKVMVYMNDASTLYDCNDDFYGADDFCGEYISKIENLPVMAGNTYYFVVDGFGGECGDFNLRITGNVQPVPVPISNWAIFLGIFLILSSSLFLYKKREGSVPSA